MSGRAPPSAKEVLEAERARPAAPPGAKDVARARLAALLGPSSGLGGSGATPGGHDPRDPSIEGGAAQAATASGRLAGLTGVARLGAAFILGSAVTAAAFVLAQGPQRSRPTPPTPTQDTPEHAPPEVSATSEAPRPPPPATSAAPPLGVPRETSSATPLPTTAGHGRPSTAPTGRPAGDLAGERALVERARSALARGDAAQALSAANLHEESFPRGQLTEEREVLAIQALVALGRKQEAADRAGRFRLAFPDSVLLPVVDEVLR